MIQFFSNLQVSVDDPDRLHDSYLLHSIVSGESIKASFGSSFYPLWTTIL